MFVEFSSLPEDAKVWIYPSSKKFYPTEIDALEQKISSFITSWKSDDIDFKASYLLLHNRFIILAADDTSTTITNKDINVLISFILELQNTYNTELLDRMNVCFKQGDFTQYKDLKSFKKLLKDKAITAKTIVFDNLVATKHDFDSFWEVPIEDSWYSRFL